MQKPKLVIFDCDGVLVDSEIVANRIEAEYKTRLGFPTTLEEQIRKFVGLSLKSPAMVAELARLPADYLESVDALIHDAYLTQLRPVKGIPELLDRLDVPACVASNSHPHWLARKLEMTGLKRHFGDAVFSGLQVKNAKPAPDLFLHAAARMGFEPGECLVIEDSVSGVTAGHAAGMRVVGFLGGAHIAHFPDGHAGRLRAAGADLIVSRIEEAFEGSVVSV